ncbi:Ribonuclease HI [Minicystis rosea]|nr:Ribonuclease HI [Minicystis rosea]
MPWVRAILRGQKIYARADEKGALVADNGRVEIRYKPNDGRMYQARADNLEIADPTPLPDETCSAAEAVAKPDASSKSGPAKAGGAKSGAPAGTPGPVAPGTVIVYADGACSGNPGPAGLGVVVIDGPRRVEISEYLGVGTNNIAELTAVLRALDEIDAARAVMIYTDSQYTIGVVQKGWKAKANQELVADLRSALAGRPQTRLSYVPGHAGVLLNERADALAREAVSARKTRRQVYESKGPETATQG